MCYYNILFICNYIGYIGLGMLLVVVVGVVFIFFFLSSILVVLRIISKLGVGLLFKFICSIVICYICIKWVFNFDFNYYRNSIFVIIKFNWYNDFICIK